MKEQIIEILKDWLQAKDAIIFTDDQAINSVASEINQLIDAEVERRIAERMPTEEEIEEEMTKIHYGEDWDHETGSGSQWVYFFNEDQKDGWIKCGSWFRNRMKGGK